MYVLDIHTTSSDSAIFSIPSRDAESLELAKSIQAPVIQGLTEDLDGTSLHYFNSAYHPIPTVSIGFESGHHTDPESVQRSLSAILQLLQYLGVYKGHVSTQTPQSALSEVFDVVYRHQVDDITQWHMLPGYQNFQVVKKNEHLAVYQGKNILCPCDGHLLMPLYQSLGQDGFFIVKKRIHC
jgi:predicted deacylase